MAASAEQLGIRSNGKGRVRDTVSNLAVAGGVAVLAIALVLSFGEHASAVVTTYDGKVTVTTFDLDGDEVGNTTVHGDGSILPGPLAGWCDDDGTAETEPYPAAQAPFFMGGSVEVSVDGASTCTGNDLPDGEYHITLIEHAFVNHDGSTNSEGVATYDDSEIVADCNRKDVFVGGTAWHPDELEVTNGTGSAEVPYFFTLNPDPAEAGAVCISHKNNNAGMMIPISAWF